MTGPVLPLGPDDAVWVRKQRVAEIHDLFAASGFNWSVFYLLLTQRYEAPADPHLEPAAAPRRLEGAV